MAYRLKLNEPMGRGFQRIAIAQIDRAIVQIDAATETVSVHEARKCLKRTRALLRFFRPRLGDDTFKNLNSALRDIGQSLSGPRDIDVLGQTVAHLAQAGEVLKRKNWHASKAGREDAKQRIALMKGERALALRILLRQIQRLGREVLQWRARVGALATQLPAVKTISEHMPGFGPIIASTVVAELGSPDRFYNQKAYAKSTGLTPGYRESGEKARRSGSHARAVRTRAGPSRAR